MAAAHCNLGNVYLHLGHKEEAIRSFKEAIRLDPDDAVTHHSLGVAYYKKKQYQEAAASFRRAVGLRPDYAVAHYNLGVSYLALKNRALALEQQRALAALSSPLGAELFAGIFKSKVLSVTNQQGVNGLHR